MMINKLSKNKYYYMITKFNYVKYFYYFEYFLFALNYQNLEFFKIIIRVLLTCVFGAQVKVTTIKKFVWDKIKF